MVDDMMIVSSKWGIYAFILTVVLIAVFKKQRLYGGYGIIALVAALLISRILKYTANRERPFIAEDVHILFEKSAPPSSPE
ncbi:hypothetical protein MHB50_06375 [Siminovitchia sp. FSL H7-0308]|uniref:Uncharacterized protein n=1 Tax=Siminovitchia thermophila TaxID=1245522 RepID=A0ABS2R9D1_9BACI|nr:hypothetical protein [Siminovitchia thermophila]MBM7716238.1 hypothetical protein [Siminovitchia thermophila]